MTAKYTGSAAPNGIQTTMTPDTIFQQFIRHAPVAMAMFDPQMRYLAWSQLWLALYGLGTRDLDGLCHYDVFPDLPERWRAAHRLGLKGEKVDCNEDCYRLADGRELWQRWSIRPIARPTGEVAGIALYVIDISNEKSSEAALRIGNERLSQITDSLGIGIFEHDFATERTEISDVYLDLFHIRPEQAPTTLGDWITLLRPVDLAAYHDARRQAFDPAGDGRFSCEVNPLVAGQKRMMEVKARVSFVGEGAERRPERLIGIITDQTESRRLQEALSRAQRLETVGRLAGMVAHDFNNLLTVILSNLELADLRTVDADVRHLLHQAVEAADLGAGFTKRLLALAGGHQRVAAPLAIDEHFSRVWELFQRVLNDGINFRFRPGAERVMVAIDPAEIDGAVLNLLVNARDAQPGGGEVTLRTDVVEISQEAADQFRGGRPGRFLRLSVSDRGLGMPPEVAARAGEPFFSTKGAGRGTGLGLTSVILAVERAGGFVHIRSEPGAGTTVVLHLPVVDAPHCPPSVEATTYPFGNGELVLVVEDDALLREAVMQRLEAIGYAVNEAANGEVALALIEAGEPVDLVFTDVVMPGAISGNELVRRVRLQHPGIGLLLTSGHVSTAHREPLLLDPPVELLAKPYLLKALADAVARALRRVQAPE